MTICYERPLAYYMVKYRMTRVAHWSVEIELKPTNRRMNDPFFFLLIFFPTNLNLKINKLYTPSFFHSLLLHPPRPLSFCSHYLVPFLHHYIPLNEKKHSFD